MPTSDICSVPIVIETIKKVKPQSILDIGCGFGKYGFLLREQLDICADQKASLENYKIDKKNWRTKIDAVEVFQGYICELQRYIYNTIHIGNITDLIESLDKYDVILLADIMEHFKKEPGKQLLNKIYDKANKLVVITTPIGEYKQGNLCGNNFENHHSIWRISDFRNYKNKKIIKIYNKGLCIFISKGKDKIRIPSLKERLPIGELIKSRIYLLLGDKIGGSLICYLVNIKRKVFRNLKTN